jgi:uncharacterized membrane protein HdeD (DUF308 family)
MITDLARDWWAFVLRGIVALLFGFVALVWPDFTIRTLTYVFGFYALLDGIFALVAAWAIRSSGRWWVLLWRLLGIVAGCSLFSGRDVTALALLTVIAAWAILTGILEIVAAIRLRKEIENEVWMGLSGLGSILFGVLLLIWPQSGMVTISWIIGFYAIVFGISMLALGFRLRGLNKKITKESRRRLSRAVIGRPEG